MLSIHENNTGGGLLDKPSLFCPHKEADGEWNLQKVKTAIKTFAWSSLAWLIPFWRKSRGIKIIRFPDTPSFYPYSHCLQSQNLPWVSHNYLSHKQWPKDPAGFVKRPPFPILASFSVTHENLEQVLTNYFSEILLWGTSLSQFKKL